MSNINITIEQDIPDNSGASLTEVASYLGYLKHVDISKPVVNNDSLSLCLSIIEGLGGISNFGSERKYIPLFGGGKTFHRIDIKRMTQFFDINKNHLLAVADNIIKVKVNNCNLTFATGLANNFSVINDVAAAYSSLNCKSALSGLNNKQLLLRNTMIANLLAQVLHHLEQEVASLKNKAA